MRQTRKAVNQITIPPPQVYFIMARQPNIPEPYASWPVLMSRNQAARLLGINRKTLAASKEMLDRCSVVVGGKPKVVRDRLLKELGILEEGDQGSPTPGA